MGIGKHIHTITVYQTDILTPQLNISTKSSYFQPRKWLLFSFAYGRGATTYDENEREKP
jgi:hypothetical protein